MIAAFFKSVIKQLRKASRAFVTLLKYRCVWQGSPQTPKSGSYAIGNDYIHYYLVIPGGNCFDPQKITDGMFQLLNSAIDQAFGRFQNPVEVLIADAKSKYIYSLNQARSFSIHDLQQRGIHCLINLGFLLSDDPPIVQMQRQAKKRGISWCGIRSTRDTHACTFICKFLLPTISEQSLWNIITHLTATKDDDVEQIWQQIANLPLILPSSSQFERSPSVRDCSNLWSKRWANSTRFLNTAVKEMLSSPQDSRLVKGDPTLMIKVLIAQRDVSQVPWIFNTLINEIEYRMGTVKPESFPLEVHLSITGFCNIECRFCSYTRAVGRFEFVKPEQIAKLDFLKYVQTLRLHSRLGEPTTNKHLPAIIQYVSTKYPHIGMNFFTNGLNLNRPGMIDAIVGNVRWINVSLNAATRESWKEQCKIDQFDHVCNNLRELLRVKRSRNAIWPLVFGSMVLNKANLADLPHMPALCRELGIDRFTAFPFFALGYGGRGKYGPEMTLALCRQEYDDLYWQTIREAEIHEVSIELPLPSSQMQTSFGLEVRKLNNFANIESNEWPLGRFLTRLTFREATGTYCHFLWRQVGIGSTENGSHTKEETHYLYPCLGPLGNVDLSRQTSFRFPSAEDFLKLWNHPIFFHLREAQHQQGVCDVCDACRQKDTRDPKEFPELEKLVDQFSAQYSGIENSLEA